MQNDKTNDIKDMVLNKAKWSRKGDYSTYSQLKMELLDAELSHKEYEETCRELARELRI